MLGRAPGERDTEGHRTERKTGKGAGVCCRHQEESEGLRMPGKGEGHDTGMPMACLNDVELGQQVAVSQCEVVSVKEAALGSPEVGVLGQLVLQRGAQVLIQLQQGPQQAPLQRCREGGQVMLQPWGMGPLLCCGLLPAQLHVQVAPVSLFPPGSGWHLPLSSHRDLAQPHRPTQGGQCLDRPDCGLSGGTGKAQCDQARLWGVASEKLNGVLPFPVPHPRPGQVLGS